VSYSMTSRIFMHSSVHGRRTMGIKQNSTSGSKKTEFLLRNVVDVLYNLVNPEGIGWDHGLKMRVTEEAPRLSSHVLYYRVRSRPIAPGLLTDEVSSR
jgi:hypothetical protein